MLIRNNIGATAHLVARHSNAVVKFIILGSAEIFVKSADLGNNLSAVSRMKKAVKIFLLRKRPSVRRNRTAEQRILSRKQGKLPA